MKYFFISDLHVDFYAPLSRNVSTLRKYFEAFFERNFLPADACCIAGDIANDYFTYVEFLKFIAEKYNCVYVCLGNHDIIMELSGHFGVDREFKTSEEKIAYFVAEADKRPLLELFLFPRIALPRKFGRRKHLASGPHAHSNETGVHRCKRQTPLALM